MAFAFLKSPNETPWDRFSHRMSDALTAASVELRTKHKRRLALGSPVKLGTDQGDLVRVPIIVSGGAREYAIAYLTVANLSERPDHRRLERIAMEAVVAALPYVNSAPAKPGDVLYTYP